VAGLQDYIIASRYAFQPYPEDWVTKEAQQRGAAIRASFQGRPGGAMADYLRAHKYTDAELIWQAMAGAVVAFAAPAVASIMAIAQRWKDSGELFSLIGEDAAPDEARVRSAVIAALSRTPVPSLLYRSARDNAELDNEAIPASTPIVIGLGALYEEAVANGEDQPEKWLFGGDHGGARDTAKPAHGCPAREAALAVMTGTFAALLEQKDVRPERDFVVSFAAPIRKSRLS
jgi:hypothetical protein